MKKPVISLIYAISENHVIGLNNALPWSLPDDLAFFKKNTLNKPIIMGRKTFESIGKPLPKRTNIVISSKKQTMDDVFWYTDINDVIRDYQDEKELMIIGGAQLFQQTIPLADRLYLTRVHAEVEGDCFMPPVDLAQATLCFEAFHDKDERHAYDFTFQIWEMCH